MKLSFPNFWLKRGFLALVLWPFSLLYLLVIFLRYFLYRLNILKTKKFPVPVVIVGNISVGGTGKTPFVIWLANYCRELGFKPGVVSRGYGGKKGAEPLLVRADSKPSEVGDEPILIARNTQAPVVVSPKRVAAVEKLLAETDCNLVISDDGLQHYALGRDYEIVLIDGMRKLGNCLCLPAGPLREPISRLKRIDCLVITDGVNILNQYSMELEPGNPINLSTGETIALAKFVGRKVHAVAGIGNPQRFFQSLYEIGMDILEHPFPDHYEFSSNDLDFNDNHMIIMTEKDAVKCESFANEKMWYLPVTAKLTDELIAYLKNILIAARPLKPQAKAQWR